MANNVVQLVDKNGNNVFPIAGGVADGTITSSMLASGVVNNANLTIKKNGTTVATFGANASSPVDANITTPTKTSDLTNDSGFAVISNNTTTPSSVAFVGTNNIQDGAVTGSKVAFTTFTDQITLNETPLLIKATEKLGRVVINYLGEDIKHTSGSLLFTLPTGYRPAQQIWAPFASSVAQGNIAIYTDGRVLVNTTTYTSGSARICTQIVYDL